MKLELSKLVPKIEWQPMWQCPDPNCNSWNDDLDTGTKLLPGDLLKCEHCDMVFVVPPEKQAAKKPSRRNK